MAELQKDLGLLKSGPSERVTAGGKYRFLSQSDDDSARTAIVKETDGTFAFA